MSKGRRGREEPNGHTALISARRRDERAGVHAPEQRSLRTEFEGFFYPAQPAPQNRYPLPGDTDRPEDVVAVSHRVQALHEDEQDHAARHQRQHLPISGQLGTIGVHRHHAERAVAQDDRVVEAVGKRRLLQSEDPVYRAVERLVQPGDLINGQEKEADGEEQSDPARIAPAAERRTAMRPQPEGDTSHPAGDEQMRER